MKQVPLTADLWAYISEISAREHDVMRALREKTQELMLAHMQISPNQAQFLQFLIRLISAKKVLELGTFTGYSALAMALALPEDGKLITCDKNTHWTQHAPAFWQAAGVAHKIDLRLAPAIDTLQQLIDNQEAHTFDFVFIDADKTNYPDYYEYALQLISPKGVIAIDNVFWEGNVINPLDTRAQTRAIRTLNQKIKSDFRVEISLLPIADGLFLIHPR